MGIKVGKMGDAPISLDWGPVLLALLAPGLLSGIITALVGLLPLVGAESRADRAEREMRRDSARMERLGEVLALNDATARAQSLQLLIDLDLLDDARGRASRRAAFPDSVPHWPASGTGRDTPGTARADSI